MKYLILIRKELIEIKNKFEELSKKDQDELIKYIISERSK